MDTLILRQKCENEKSFLRFYEYDYPNKELHGIIINIKRKLDVIDRMRKIKIITDSTACISIEEQNEWEIAVLPLSVEVDGAIYNPLTDLTPESFMELMGNSKNLPKSSQPALGSFVEMYEKYIQEGYDVLSIHLTEKLSGTVNTARQAAEMVEGNVTVIDTDYIARGQAFQVLEAAKLAKEGQMSVQDITKRLTEIRSKTKLYIVVVTLENLVKGGRVGRVQGILGSLLNIKLIARLKDGQLEEEAKLRSNKKIMTYLLDVIKKESKKIVELDIEHANGLKMAEEFKEQAMELLHLPKMPIFNADPIVSTHAGNGAFAVMYYTE
ncbi:DegV domain-containing protein SPy_1493/M5005_Spy1226 [Listeria fleischmannii subsp. coloradonensis]|nr:DegV domain-containing protein SPy_1493/M5005_Spy1226 [Listeria fleischmannii subsp. coloradonensis]